MRGKKRKRQLSLNNKVLLLAVFCSCCFLRFFPFCISVFCLFFDDLFFFCVCFRRFPFFLWLAYFDSIQFVAFFVCAPLILGSCVFSLLSFFAALLLLSFSLFFLLPITRTRRGECVLSTYIGHSPSCSYPKRNLKYVADGAGGVREGGGLRLRGCVCRPFNVMKETRTHTGEHMT